MAFVERLDPAEVGDIWDAFGLLVATGYQMVGIRLPRHFPAPVSRVRRARDLTDAMRPVPQPAWVAATALAWP
jgi:hypothetical protein